MRYLRSDTMLKRLTILALISCGLHACDSQNPAQRSTASQPADEPPGAGWIDQRRLAGIESEPGAWLTNGRDLAQSYYSPLTQIGHENLEQLGFAWEYEIDTEHGMEATPIVVDGVLFSSGPGGTAFAVDAATGKERWRFEPELDAEIMRKICCGLVNRGVAVWEGQVFVAATDGVLYALDADTGNIVWQRNTIIDPERGYTVTSAPQIAGDMVVLGNSGAELDARGYITAYDTVTGDQQWRFFTVPGGPALGFEHPELETAAATWSEDTLWQVGLGGTVWDGMSYDPNLNLLYVGTGNAAPYARHLRSPGGGDNLFLASILAINPDDGSLVWHYQTTPAENWDYTATQKFIFADLEIAGETRKVLMQAPKNGFFYVLDRATGELLSAEPYIPVNWASHVDMETGRPVETGQGDYSKEPKLIFPGPQGGHTWQPMSYNPMTGLVYIPANESGAIWWMPDSEFEYIKGSFNMGSVYVFPMPGEWGLDGPGTEVLPPFDELAEGQADPTIRGFLRAWDPVKQELAWEVDVSEGFGETMVAFWNGGGTMTTAANLVIQGRGTGELWFYDATNGETLRRLQLGRSMMAAPMSYAVDGEQYIAVMTGFGGAGGGYIPPGIAAYEYGNRGAIIALKLGGGPVPMRPKVERDENAGVFPEPPLPRKGTADQLAAGQEHYVRHCAKCHASMDARAAGVPDLRLMSADVHAQFTDIVLGGALADKGMGSFASVLDETQVEDLHAYLIESAWKAWEKETAVSHPHQAGASQEQ